MLNDDDAICTWFVLVSIDKSAYESVAPLHELINAEFFRNDPISDSSLLSFKALNNNFFDKCSEIAIKNSKH